MNSAVGSRTLIDSIDFLKGLPWRALCVGVSDVQPDATMTITTVPLPIAAIDRGLSKSQAMPDRAETSGSFLDELKQVSGIEQVSKSELSDTTATSPVLGIPAITEQALASVPASPFGLNAETADQASISQEEQPHPPTSQNPAGQANAAIATPQPDIEPSTSDQSEISENPDLNLEKPDDEGTASDTDQNVQGAAISVPELLLTAMPVAITAQNTIAQSENEQEADANEKKEPAPTSPVTLTAFKAFAPIAGNTKTDGEALSDSESDEAGSENGSATQSDTESFSDILAKSSDPGPAKQAIDELRKAISLPSDSGQMAPASSRPTTLNDLPLEIGMRVLEGAREIKIVLSPESLGEISIKLDIAADSSISAQFMTDNPATLVLLMQDASTLKRSLDQTGFSSNSASLQFSLSRDGQQNSNPNERNSHGHAQQQARHEASYAPASTDLPKSLMKSYSFQRLDRTI